MRRCDARNIDDGGVMLLDGDGGGKGEADGGEGGEVPTIRWLGVTCGPGNNDCGK